MQVCIRYIKLFNTSNQLNVSFQNVSFAEIYICSVSRIKLGKLRCGALLFVVINVIYKYKNR